VAKDQVFSIVDLTYFRLGGGGEGGCGFMKSGSHPFLQVVKNSYFYFANAVKDQFHLRKFCEEV